MSRTAAAASVGGRHPAPGSRLITASDTKGVGKLYKPIVCGAILTGLLATASGAGAVTINGPLTAADFQALNGSGAAYGPPAPAHFFKPGPITVGSGTASDLFFGPRPGASKASTVLLVLSATAADVAALGSIKLTSDSLPSVVFHASDFFTDAQAGFPTNIGGIANGLVNGIGGPGSNQHPSLHAGADLDFGTLLTSLPGYAADALINQVTISTPIDLRVDVFGDNNGLIVNNAANSGAEGVTAGTPPPPLPEPASLALLGTGLLGFVLARRQRKTG